MQIITGMHRSGTSITARLFFEAGGDLGDQDSFYPGDKWNPDGYFEQPEFHSVNMPLINGPWGKFSYFNLPSEKTILNRAKKFSKIIPVIAEEYKGKIVKETRFCLTYPAWINYGSIIEKALICLREPIQVARSLKKRQHIPITIGLNLWYEHNYRILNYVNNIPHRILDYNNLLREDLSISELDSALKFFGLNLPEEKLINLTKKFISSSMNHNPETCYEYDKKTGDLWKLIKNMYEKQ